MAPVLSSDLAFALISRDASEVEDLLCPHCGEPLETYPDPGGGVDQDYVEDCAVCCRPLRLHARYDEEGR